MGNPSTQSIATVLGWLDQSGPDSVYLFIPWAESHVLLTRAEARTLLHDAAESGRVEVSARRVGDSGIVEIG